MKFTLIIASLFLYSCGQLISANTLATTLIDYKIQQQTGKKVSEHALSYVTGKDCEIKLNIQEICKDEAFLSEKKNNLKNLVQQKLKSQNYEETNKAKILVKKELLNEEYFY